MNCFSSLHPISLAVYFISVFVITMFSQNPILLLFSLIGSVLFFIKREKNLNFFKDFGFFLIIFLIISLTNPFFSHKGSTILFFFNGNPITLEALIYGVQIALMLTAVIFWFKCFNLIFSDDKLLYLLGGFSYKIALLISSALRFIPLIKIKSEKIKASQKTLGLYSSESWTDKLKSGGRAYSALIGLGLESAVDTGATMKARGFGLKPKSRYSLYKFRKTDLWVLIFSGVSDILIFTALGLNKLTFNFYPLISFAKPDFYAVFSLSVFFIFCLLPFVIDFTEDLKWKFYISKI